MTKHTKEQIVADITAHVQKSGAKTWDEWYVGISKDAKDRLINGHGVTEWYIYRTATSSAVARAVEAYFVNELEAKGATGGGDDSADMVYAYKIGPNTRE